MCDTRMISYLSIALLLILGLLPVSLGFSCERYGPVHNNNQQNEISRRELGWQAASLLSVSSTLLVGPGKLSAAWAKEEAEGNSSSSSTTSDNNNKEEGLMSTNKVADILHVVPTFTIVDAKGVPYMVVGEDAKVTGYFFSTYEEANRILGLARTSADKSIREAKKAGETGEDLYNPWTKARISTVPLDFAVTLVAKSIYTKNYFQVAPAQDDVEDALEISGQKDLAEGKVPLFYMEDFKIETTGGNENKRQTPLYFRKSELEAEYKRQNKGSNKDSMPPILVTELFAVLLELVKPPAAGGGSSLDEDLRNLVLIPPKGSAQKAKQCEKAGGKEPPFALGKRNLVL